MTTHKTKISLFDKNYDPIDDKLEVNLDVDFENQDNEDLPKGVL